MKRRPYSKTDILRRERIFVAKSIHSEIAIPGDAASPSKKTLNTGIVIGSATACFEAEISRMLARIAVLFVMVSCLVARPGNAAGKHPYRIDPVVVDFLTRLPDDAYDQLISNDPSNPVLFYSRGLMCALKGELEDAVDDYDEAIRLDRDYADAFAGRGFALAMQGKAAQAIVDFDEWIRLSPLNPAAYYNRGQVYANNGDIRRAITDIDLAILIGGGNSEDHFVRGKLWMYLGELDRALVD